MCLTLSPPVMPSYPVYMSFKISATYKCRKNKLIKSRDRTFSKAALFFKKTCELFWKHHICAPYKASYGPCEGVYIYHAVILVYGKERLLCLTAGGKFRFKVVLYYVSVILLTPLKILSFFGG